MNNDIVGTQIGIYNILYECSEKTNDGHKLYRVQCVFCGREFNMRKAHIGRAKNCNHIGVNGTYTPTTADFVWDNQRLKKIFRGMKVRCYNKKDRSYRWYGAKGIKICEEWLANPKLFENWALANGYSNNLTIDRIDEDKDYSPENCRWITFEDNSRYKSTTTIITVDGESHTGSEWSKILGLGRNTINTYIREYGMINVIEFIHRFKNNPDLKLKLKGKQSYYNLYMNEN